MGLIRQNVWMLLLVWESLPSMRYRRSGFVAAAVAGSLLAVGGHEDSSYLDSGERFDPTSPATMWEELPPMSVAGVCCWRKCGEFFELFSAPVLGCASGSCRSLSD